MLKAQKSRQKQPQRQQRQQRQQRPQRQRQQHFHKQSQQRRISKTTHHLLGSQHSIHPTTQSLSFHSQQQSLLTPKRTFFSSLFSSLKPNKTDSKSTPPPHLMVLGRYKQHAAMDLIGILETVIPDIDKVYDLDAIRELKTDIGHVVFHDISNTDQPHLLTPSQIIHDTLRFAASHTSGLFHPEIRLPQLEQTRHIDLAVLAHIYNLPPTLFEPIRTLKVYTPNSQTGSNRIIQQWGDVCFVLTSICEGARIFATINSDPEFLKQVADTNEDELEQEVDQDPRFPVAIGVLIELGWGVVAKDVHKLAPVAINTLSQCIRRTIPKTDMASLDHFLLEGGLDGIQFQYLAESFMNSKKAYLHVDKMAYHFSSFLLFHNIRQELNPGQINLEGEEIDAMETFGWEKSDGEDEFKKNMNTKPKTASTSVVDQPSTILTFPIIINKESWLNGKLSDPVLERPVVFHLTPDELNEFESLRKQYGKPSKCAINTPDQKYTTDEIQSLPLDTLLDVIDDEREFNIDQVITFSNKYIEYSKLSEDEQFTFENRINILTELAKVF